MGCADRTEWPETLDPAALRAEGWVPTPFREFVLKVNSRCDLSCAYCYVYEMADQSWRDQPIRMSAATATRTAARIAEHVRAHDLPSVELILHGGEPLLAGPELISHIVTATREAVGRSARVGARVQTNGVRLDAGHLRMFAELDIAVAVSLDGDGNAHDRHRKFADGRGSFAAVSKSLRLLRDSFPHLFSGLLCTMDLRNDPVTTYEALLEFDPPRIDFLLPLGNWSFPPPGRSPGSAATPYADWLIAAFDRWYAAPRMETDVRLFSEIIQLLLGGRSTSEAVGLAPVAVLVIDTDGTMELSDTVRSSYPGAASSGLRVDTHTFDDALLLPEAAARQLGEPALAAECRACEMRSVCGGGQFAHRYRAGHGFANPSVYCPDLLRLIRHIRRVVAADLAAQLERLP
ncbi:FxsB family radical SAM/SPASM domain protein [Nonomuraea phyllanthi]|uniref:FxsB family radical SAM/SPASM domain protein n=1 Tax=Nonomuraea phyllanthi TaxID=2219224 RepID=A0A5C4VVP4_9ACTN|nr:FxsB family cyclophane-forming radical SAM/SPASM peptide maturase [Nonomuraea phyllanthi]KAB8190322.1 FxsB family radical SAM/SPASM domain protein [Nonomuraea phyllanthi]